MNVSPTPSDEEAVAIAAAMVVLGQGAATPVAPPAPSAWRFSKRWWVKKPRYPRR